MNKKIEEVSQKIVEEISPEKVILFGSYAWGSPTKDSDVDFFIVQKTKLPRRERQRDLRRKLFGSGIPMDLLIYTPEEMEDRIKIQDFFVEKIIKEGKLVYAK